MIILLITILHQDPYYDVYYIKSCGGDFGTPKNPDLLPQGFYPLINITVLPLLVTGQGGSQVLSLKYVCTKGFCSPATKLDSNLVFVMVMLLSLVLLFL